MSLGSNAPGAHSAFLRTFARVSGVAVAVFTISAYAGCSSNATGSELDGSAGPGGPQAGTTGHSGHAGATSHGGAAGKGIVGAGGTSTGVGGKGGSGGGLNLNAGGGPACPADTCTTRGFNCGKFVDSCGGIVDCGMCTKTGEACGAKKANVCDVGSSTCTPKTCVDQGFQCGLNTDTCNNVLDCGACTAPQTCGAVAANQCGMPANCTNLCLQQMQCSGGASTTITGTVYAPTPPKFGSPDPIYNAIVYVPNSPVMPFTQGASCDQCGSDISGSPLVLTQSAPDGTFQLQNVPVGDNIPLVIQIGKWRRQITLNVPACVDTHLTPEQSRLPRNKSEGDIPQIAIRTGSADGLECVFRKIGIDDAEFTVSADKGGAGRVNLFLGNGANDASGSAEDQSYLESNSMALDYFDMVVLDCQGMPLPQPNAWQQNLVDYANAGGRVFASHYSYDWLYNVAPFSSTADWSNPMGPPPNQNSGNTVTGILDQTFPKGVAFSKWLDVVGASNGAGSGQVTIHVARDDLPSQQVNSQVAQRWIYTQAPDPDTIQHYTFNTPVGPMSPQQCGRVLFSDFHVTGSSGSMGGIPNFPGGCDNGPMTAQEKILEFMIFDLSSCVQTTVTPMCSPTTCMDQHVTCGPTGDGCGNLLQCGMCDAPLTCGGGGTPGQCGMNGPMCIPKTCVGLGLTCGPAGDGCGNILQCGNCTLPETCGGGKTPGQCGGGEMH